MLHLCFAGGLRVSELVCVLLENVSLGRTSSVMVKGKGRRERCCRNFIFRRHFPIHKLFERSCELGLWRLSADKIATIFGKRVSRRMHGKLATVIDQIEHGHHVFRAYFKSGFLKQYEKFLTFLRNELVSNNLADFGLRKGLDHLDAVRTTFQVILPLWKETARDMRTWLSVQGPRLPELFVNAEGAAMTRPASSACSTTRACSREDLRFAPRPLRVASPAPSCAVIMLQATRDIRKVALWLGHADVRTTEVYLRMDPSEKLEAVEAVVAPECIGLKRPRRRRARPSASALGPRASGLDRLGLGGCIKFLPEGS